ncbi:MAG: hypothetical protein HGA61_03490 [Candidatus Moranbacteria bacterium]|nr:hypothetical protein [Candidatus Moranbacteria bacterium]
MFVKRGYKIGSSQIRKVFESAASKLNWEVNHPIYSCGSNKKKKFLILSATYEFENGLQLIINLNPISSRYRKSYEKIEVASIFVGDTNKKLSNLAKEQKTVARIFLGTFSQKMESEAVPKEVWRPKKRKAKVVKRGYPKSGNLTVRVST